MKSPSQWYVVTVLLLMSLGCGPDRPPIGLVSGTIKLDGKPLTGAGIVFQPVSGRPSYGMTDSDGRYTLEYAQGIPGALIGRHTVIIRTLFIAEYPGDPKARPEVVPRKYNDETELSADVEAGENTIDFDLTTPPGEKPRRQRQIIS